VSAKEKALVNWLVAAVGDPYIFGARGQICTPNYRRQVAVAKPQYVAQITKNCPVLSGGQSGCAGCKYAGRRSWDCRGLTAAAVKAVTGRSIMGTGATSQWNDDSNWATKGEITTMPKGIPVVLFRRNGTTMQHTGYALGDGTYIHAGGHGSGVTRHKLQKGWTHWAIPVGFYTDEELQKIMGGKPMEKILRRGSAGHDVKEMQKSLIDRGYDLGKYGADGKFGAVTEKAVMDFQQDHGLSLTGAWGDDERAKLNPQPEEPEQSEDSVIIALTHETAKELLKALKEVFA
jgi:hypothetical protein